jgi:AraC-like DNA-binding protein
VASIDDNPTIDRQMKYWYEKPNKLLTEFVRTVLIMEGFSKSDSNNLPVFTNGMPALFCKTEKNKNNYEHITHLSLLGKLPNDIWTVNKQTTIITYFLKPFTMASMFSISAKKISEKPFDLSIWNPHKYNALKTQLIYSTVTSSKIEVLDNLLIQQFTENQKVCEIVQYATDLILNNSSKEIISEILEALNLNERKFQRIFKKSVGITPTQYRRICQFQQSFGQLRDKRFNKISEVAYDNGFADQSHFIRSFKEFIQITPNDYLKKGLKNKNR